MHGQRLLLRRGDVLALRQLAHAQGRSGIFADHVTGEELEACLYIQSSSIYRSILLLSLSQRKDVMFCSSIFHIMSETGIGIIFLLYFILVKYFFSGP